MAIKVKSAKQKRKYWRNDMPPKEKRILVEDAIAAAGNPNRLAKKLGITRSAVYQWRPPYRMDPYLPIEMAEKFMKDSVLRNNLKLVKSH